MATQDNTSGIEPGTPTSVYRYFDEFGCLIYVGITNQGIGRNRQHNKSADWWPYVANQSVEHYDSRAEALAVEAESIVKFKPPFNRALNPDQAKSLAAYLATRASIGAAPQSVQDLWRITGGWLPVWPSGATSVASSPGHHLLARAVSMVTPHLKCYVNGARKGQVEHLEMTNACLRVSLSPGPTPMAGHLRLKAQSLKPGAERFIAHGLWLGSR